MQNTNSAIISGPPVICDCLNSTNNSRFSTESVPTKTRHRYSKCALPLMVGAAAGAPGVRFIVGTGIVSSVKGALLGGQVAVIQRSVSQTDEQQLSLEVSFLLELAFESRRCLS